jgi:F-type H+-transporting ATPase subunit b
MHLDWWTLGLQAINFVVLVWLLQHFLYKPVLAVIARRRQETDALLDDATAAKRGAEALQRALEQERAAIASEREQALAAAHESAGAESRKLLQQAQAEAAKLIADANKAIERDRAAASAALTEAAARLAVTIAQRLLQRIRPQDTADTFLNQTCAEIQSLPLEAREGLTASLQSGAGVEVVTAAPLSTPEVERHRAAISNALGTPVRLSFKHDPKLIAGLELRFAHTVLSNTWIADLERVLQEVNKDGHDAGDTRPLADALPSPSSTPAAQAPD